MESNGVYLLYKRRVKVSGDVYDADCARRSGKKSTPPRRKRIQIMRAPLHGMPREHSREGDGIREREGGSRTGTSGSNWSVGEGLVEVVDLVSQSGPPYTSYTEYTRPWIQHIIQPII